jgi:glycosyltransferase involved in cell wall biosynthesis
LSASIDDNPLSAARVAGIRPKPGDDLKLAVVIPAFNEAATIGAVVAAVPREIARLREVEVIVVDDGSSDATSRVARAVGADRVERHRRNRGLVETFRTGVNAALAGGADVIVHLDADGQHDPRYIPRLIAPIVLGYADVVVGARPLADTAQITRVRRHGNRLGSWVVRRMTKLPVSDATSGYRAFSREALLRLNVISEFTYTLETLIRAARMRLAVVEVGIPALPRRHGQSRMTRSVTRYIGHAGGQAFRTMLHTNPLTIFGRAALVMLASSVAFTAWFLVGYQSGGMHLPALLAALLTFVLAVTFFVSGLIADGISTSHRLLEELLFRTRRIEHDLWGPDGQEETASNGAPAMELAIETVGVGSR